MNVEVTEGLDTTMGRERQGAPCKIVMTGQGITGDGRLPLLYAHAVEKAGGEPRVYSPFTEREGERPPDELWVRYEVDLEDTSPLDDACGLLLPGGGDIDPARYGAEAHPRTRRISHERDTLELALLNEALERDMPVLAICRGFQLLNVAMGGTLDQNLADNAETIDHDRDMPRAEPVHSIHIEAGSVLEDIFGTKQGAVNSHHHQGADVVADGLDTIAWAGDGILEAVSSNRHTWVLGVQWHPEVMAPVDHRQERIFERFLSEAERYAARSASLGRAS